jgi:putative GTP pyrophosphokinase
LIAKIPGLNIVSREDYVKNPKENGYSSLHLEVQVEIYSPGEGSKLIPIEIQIRDKAMNLWASVEHIVRYKKKDHDPKAEEYFKKMAETLTEFDEVAMKLRDYDSVAGSNEEASISLVGQLGVSIKNPAF